VRFRADGSQFIPINLPVEADTDPTPSPHVRRSKETIRFGCDHVILGTRWCRTPQVGKAMIVVALRPQHDELSASKEGGCAVAQPFGDSGQSHADGPDTLLDLRLAHRGTLVLRISTTLMI
jgi:hypothetical protein